MHYEEFFETTNFINQGVTLEIGVRYKNATEQFIPLHRTRSGFKALMISSNGNILGMAEISTSREAERIGMLKELNRDMDYAISHNTKGDVWVARSQNGALIYFQVDNDPTHPYCNNERRWTHLGGFAGIPGSNLNLVNIVGVIRSTGVNSL